MRFKTVVFAVLVIVLVVFSGSMIWASEYPSAKDYEKDVPPAILKMAGTLPDGYMFPNDWVKKQDWKAIRDKHSGTKLTIMFEGTDIGAPLMTQKQFEQLSGMKLVFIGVPVQMQFEKLLISYSTGAAAYDVSTMLSQQMPVFARFLEPLDDWIKKWNYDWSDLFPNFQKLMTRDGKIMMLPNDFDVHFWHSRKKFLDQAGLDGPPKTWDEVVEYSKKLKPILPSGVWPTGFMMSRDILGWESFWDVAAPFGANYFKEGTWEPDMASEEAIKATNFLKQMLDDGLLAPGSPSWDYVRQLEAWNTGNLAMCIQYPIQESYVPAMSKIAEEPRIHSIVPKGIGPKGRIAPHGTSTNVGLGISKQSNVKEAAFIWAAFNSSAEVQYIYTITGTGIDYGRKSIFANKRANEFYPNAKASLETLPYWYLPLNIPVNTEVLAAMIPAVHDVWTGKGKAEEILPKANEQVREIMQRYGYLEKTPPEPPRSFWNYDYYQKEKDQYGLDELMKQFK